ncbi:MAG: metal-sulfur cluster assembly factor [Solirubrobacterales bacterium]
MTEGEAWEALAQVIDPELGIDIVELGLVYRVDVDERVVSVLMTLTTPGCPLHDVIVQGAERALAQPGGPRVEVEVTFDPPWDPGRIGAGGLRQLGAPGAGG